MANINSKTPEPTQAASLRRQISALEQRLATLLDGPVQPLRLDSRPAHRLSDRKVKTLNRPGFYADGGNLYLNFRAPPAKHWVFRWKRNGRAHDLSLGSYPLMGLAEAREAAIAVRRQLRDGLDPLEARKAHRLAEKIEQAKTMLFRSCAEAYIAAHASGWRSEITRRGWPASLTAHAFPTLGELPVEAIDTAMVLGVLQPIWAAKPVTAARLRSRLELILDWAAACEYRSGPNPARWRGHLDKLLPKPTKIRAVRHHKALPYAELPAFMAEWIRRDRLPALALCFIVMTCARLSEALGAKWEEFDLKARVWVIPAERMKMGREHRVPLSAPVLKILATLKRLPPSTFVFPGRGTPHLSRAGMLLMLRRAGCDGITIHGFRSTFADWCAERTHFSGELREMALAHAVGSKVEAAYRRGDLFEKRRQVMDTWARYCTASLPAGKVVPMIALTA